MKPVRPFQIRWNEPLGKPECPYMRRWVFNFWLFAIRIHHWIRSDDKRHFHNHPWWFWTFVLKGAYVDVSYDPKHPEIKETAEAMLAGNFAFRKASHLHYVLVPEGGCWTLLLTGPQTQNWGFWINNRIMRPLRFFSRYGHPPCSEQ
jgi:hypothetical protein